VPLCVLERLNRDLRFPCHFLLRAADAPPSGRGVELSATISVAGASGRIRAYLPDEAMAGIDAVPRAPAPSPLDDASWPFAVSAGSVDLSVDELAGIEPGDVLILDGVQRLHWPGGADRGWTLHEQGNSGAFVVDKYFEGIVEMDTAIEPELAKADLERLPVRLYVVLGEKELTLGEVRALAPGSMFELTAGKADPVRLMATGKVIGEGELVDVEGKLGVKVLHWRTA